MIRLSIIIPVYNVEKYIERCLMYCLNQDIPYDEYEIIVVNDGSKDKSISIVERIQDSYHNIKIINQENKGQASARNTGINNSVGEYIWFIDSDDFIKENCLASILKIAQNNNLDVLSFNLQLHFEDGTIKPYKIKFEKENFVYKGHEFITKVDMPQAPWASLFKRSYLNVHNLRFISGIKHEDTEFTPRAYYLAHKILYIDRPLYFYFQRDGSTMRSKYKKRADDLLTVCDSLYDFAKKYAMNDKRGYYYLINKVNFAFTQSLKYYSDSETLTLNEYKNKDYYPLNFNKYMSFKDIVKSVLANISLNLYIRMFNKNK